MDSGKGHDHGAGQRPALSLPAVHEHEKKLRRFKQGGLNNFFQENFYLEPFSFFSIDNVII
jgi:hypothetical protein